MLHTALRVMVPLLLADASNCRFYPLIIVACEYIKYAANSLVSVRK